MVASIRDQRNITFSTSVITTLNITITRMTLPPNISMDIDDFGSRNVNNYDEVRGHTMTSNKMSSSTVLMSSSEVLVDYATRMEQLNNISNNKKTRKPIDSS